MEGYVVGLLKIVAVVEDRLKPGVDKGAHPVLPGGYFEGDSDANLDDVRP